MRTRPGRRGPVPEGRRQGAAPHLAVGAAAVDGSGAARLLAHIAMHAVRRRRGRSAPPAAHRAVRGRSTRLHGLAIPQESVLLGSWHRLVRHLRVA